MFAASGRYTPMETRAMKRRTPVGNATELTAALPQNYWAALLLGLEEKHRGRVVAGVRYGNSQHP